MRYGQNQSRSPHQLPFVGQKILKQNLLFRLLRVTIKPLPPKAAIFLKSGDKNLTDSSSFKTAIKSVSPFKVIFGSHPIASPILLTRLISFNLSLGKLR